MRRLLILIALQGCIAWSIPLSAQAYEASVRASAEVQTAPPKIKLSWQGLYSVTGYQIWRKLKGETSWGSPVATLDASALMWEDANVAVGISYEYKIIRTISTGWTGYAYINAGIQLPMVENRGRVILLVDDYFSTPLSVQLEQLKVDLEGDGWTVVRHDVSRNAPVPSVKGLVVGEYNADPVNTRAVFIVGHVPVPYSGNMAPDGHWEHQGAWSADVFYGDVNGTWTDNQVSATGAVDPRNHNVPGDGKYDQSNIPSPVELAVGRVDFFNLPVFPQSELVLMGNYLTKLHNWKVRAFTAGIRGLVDDNFVGYGDAFASNGYRGFSPLVGKDNVSDNDYFTSMESQSYLWSYGCGGGYWDRANGVGTSSDFATKNVKGVFTVLFGSSFGDFDCQNNFMRSSLGSGNVLSCFWAGYPNWFFHHLAMGETMGYALRLTQGNTGHYAPANPSAGQVHIALLGDPTLRMAMVGPPSNVAGTVNGNTVQLTWTASTDNIIGYHVYRFVSASQSWQRITTQAVTGTSYTENLAGAGGTIRYMVRALKLEQGASGTYYNLSIGAFGQAQGGSQAVDCLGVPGGQALAGTPCNDGDDCTTGDLWNASCQCQGTYQDTDGDGICNALDNCPSVPGQVGSPCNDGNPCTVNDVLNSNCQCAGTWKDTDGDGLCDAQDNCPSTPGQIGSPCDDGDPCTVNDKVNANCQCAGTFQDSDADGLCNALDNCPFVTGTIGSACDDGDPCTGNDILDANCNCAGTPLQDSDNDGVCDMLDNCPNTPGEVGSPCDDGDPCTTGDVLDAACQCTGIIQDADGDGICDALDGCPGIPGTVGTPCDDGDPCTDNDVLDANCQCTGTLQDADGDGICDVLDDCPNTPGQVGSPCDDGDLCTTGDVLDAACQCTGIFQDADSDGICDALDGCPGIPGTVGTPCDDGDPCTENDVLDANCQCAGTFQDADGDGICDVIDECPNTPGEAGSPCDDGDPCTTGDMLDAACQCTGLFQDADGDGICDALDGCPGIPGTVGTPCDDGDPCTDNDVLDANCQCAGAFSDSDGDGICDAEDQCPFDPEKIEPGHCGCGQPEPDTPCDDGQANTINDSIGQDCTCSGQLVDCLGQAGGTNLPGTPCDDGNPDTGNDTWTPDCVCTGGTIDCEGVPDGGALPGTPCDDGDVSTVGDSWTADCNCMGLVADCEGIPGGSALPGTPCDDQDPLTTNDNWTSDCSCTGIPVDCEGVIGGGALPGASCDDGDASTGNDAWTADCSCAGELIDCLGVTGGTALPGTACDDGDASTGNDAWTLDCSCAGELIDCLGVPGGTALPGTACDDGDFSTGADTWSLNCSCVGLAYDCLFQPGGIALPGTPCDDNDPGTGNDVWTAACECVGQPIDCAGVIGGAAFVDVCGICAGGNTGITPNPDGDGDGVPDCLDGCPDLPDPGQEDFDHDGVGDVCDNCPWVYNPDQADSDQNGIGDACSEISVAEVAGTAISIHVQPNPVEHELEIVGAGPDAHEVVVHDLTGARVLVQRFESRIDVSSLSAGMYILEMFDAHGTNLARACFVRQ